MDVDDHNGSELLMTSRFGKLCMAGDYEAAAKLMRETGASGADLQLRSIEEDKARLAVLKYFRHAFEGRCDFDLTEAHLGKQIEREKKTHKITKRCPFAYGHWRSLQTDR